jgi:hypothetical protein
MFQPMTFFRAGLKIIGMLTIIWSLTHVVSVIFTFYSIYNQSDLMIGSDLMYYRFSLVFQAVYPIVLFGLGAYLLKGGEAIVQLAFRGSDENSEDKVGELFNLFMKLAGLALIIYAIPKAVQLVANLLFVTSATLIDTSFQKEFITQNLLITVIQLLLGVYLLRSGKVFYNIGFKKQNDTFE